MPWLLCLTRACLSSVPAPQLTQSAHSRSGTRPAKRSAKHVLTSVCEIVFLSPPCPGPSRSR
eukprot:1580348-Prymnesium_polylepis.1